jgi:predicted phage-related endonuclease
VVNALSEVEETFLALDAKYSVLYAACTSDAERGALQHRYAQAEAAYQSCVGKMLADDDAEIASLSARLTAVNNQIKQAETVMGDVSKVLGVIDEALSIGAQLLALAGV